MSGNSNALCSAQSTPLCGDCGKTGGACPAECIAVSPGNTTGTVYGSASADSTSGNPVNVTPATFVATALKSVSGTGYAFASGVTLASAKTAITKGLLAHPEYWVPAVVQARTDVRSAKAAPTGDLLCGGVYIPQTLGKTLFTTDLPQTAVPTSCKEAVAYAVRLSGADGGAAAPISNTQLTLMCQACGITGVMKPVPGLQQPSKSMTDLAMAVGVGALLVGIILIIVLIAKHHKAKKA